MAAEPRIVVVNQGDADIKFKFGDEALQVNHASRKGES